MRAGLGRQVRNRTMQGLSPRGFSDRLRRFLFVAAVAFWPGGFTFYSAVVIHVGSRVLGGHLRQGFITRQVSGRLNVAAVIALPLMAWHTIAIWRTRRRFGRTMLAGTLLLMALIQVELFILHPAIDRLLDAHAQTILDYDRFRRLHLWYLTSSTIQWCAGILHLWSAS
jgi:hypothetical protein